MNLFNLLLMSSADFSQFIVTTADETACEISPVKVRTLSLHAPAVFTRTSGKLLDFSAFSPYPYFRALYAVPVRQVRGLPTASFRFRLTAATLAVQLCASSLPTRTRDFHPLEFSHAGQTKNKPGQNSNEILPWFIILI